MPNIVISLILYLGILFEPQVHPVHIAVANLEYISETKQFEITFKFFKDDFEAVAQTLYHSKFCADSIKAENILPVKNYIDSNFTIQSGRQNSKTKLRFIEHITDEESVWLKFAINMNIKKKLIIKNSLFLDFFYDQQNLLIFTYGNTQKGISFNYKTQTSEFKW